MRPTDDDHDSVRVVKDRLVRACTLYNRALHSEVEAEIREEFLQDEVARLRGVEAEVAGLREVARLRRVEAAINSAVVCPQCGGTSLKLVEQLPDHDIFQYRCNACRTEFRAA